MDHLQRMVHGGEHEMAYQPHGDLTGIQIAGLTGYEEANTTALALWEAVYPNVLLIALTDTFSTKAFFAVRSSQTSSILGVMFALLQEFVKNPKRARHWQGLRQDSGDPFAFAPWAKKIYEEMGIDYKEKVILYSDALNKEKVLGLQRQCDTLGFPCT